MNLVDTSAWIEYFLGGPNAGYFSKPIEDVAKLIVPVVCFYEVFKIIYQVVGEAQALQAVGQMRLGEMVPLGEEIALSAALISIRHRLAMADSIIYASAQSCGASLWTQDVDFKDLPGVFFRASAKTRR